MKKQSSVPIGTCPLCGGQVFEFPTVYLCANNISKKQMDGTFKNIGDCRFKVFKTFRGGILRRDAMARLLEGKSVKLCCQAQSGKSYEADVVLNPDNDHMPTVARKRIARCPSCGGWIIEAHNLYRCENNKSHYRDGFWVNEGICSWRVPKTLRGMAVTVENAVSLAVENSAVMHGFHDDGGQGTEVAVTLDASHDWLPRFRAVKEAKASHSARTNQTN